MSARLDFLTTRDQRAADRPARTLGEAFAADRPAWYRIRIYYARGGSRVYTLQAWTDQFKPCDPGVTWQQLLALHPDVDWWREHDVDAATGHVYAVPEPHEDGALPELDGTFGPRRPPHLLADRYGTAPLPIGRAA